MSYERVGMLKFFDHITGKPLNVFTDKECHTAYPWPLVLPIGEPPSIFLDGKNWAEKVYGVAMCDDMGNEMFRFSPLTGEPKVSMSLWRLLFL